MKCDFYVCISAENKKGTTYHKSNANERIDYFMGNMINTYYDLKDNWFALFVSIVKDISPDRALIFMLPSGNKVLNTKEQKPKNVYDKFQNTDIEKMIELKKPCPISKLQKCIKPVIVTFINILKNIDQT